jgi:hypothetical protein
VNHETAEKLTGALTYTGTSQSAVNAGSYTITPSGLRSSNYDISYVSSTLTVKQRPVTVTAEAKTKVVGSVDPALTYKTNSGLVSGDSLGVELTRTAGEVANKTYPITLASSGNANYTITYVGHTLAITQPTAVTAAQVNTLPTAQINSLSTTQLSGLTIDQVRGLTTTQVKALTADHSASLVAQKTLGEISISTDGPFSFTVPSDTFVNKTSPNTKITLSANPPSNVLLPSWLIFNQQTGTFSGTPPSGFSGSITINLTAQDSQGSVAVQSFKISVVKKSAPAPSNANIGSTVDRSASSQAVGLLSDRISQVVGGGTLFNISPSQLTPSVPAPSVPTAPVIFVPPPFQLQ